MSLLTKKEAHTNTVLLFGITLFLSATLMFGLQPMIGKMLLPIVGGTPSGWIVAMAFFQVMLLVGYFLAHFLSRFTPRMHGALYIIALAIGAAFLPIHLSAPEYSPGAFDVFYLLTLTVGIPFVAISAASSTLQRLFTTTSHASAKDPYFLYAASNMGSFTGLFLYPFLIEPRFTLSTQSYNWLLGYVLLMALTLGCLFISRKKGEISSEKKVEKKKKSPPLPWKKKSEWIILSFLPSALLLAVTTHITTDIFSVPMIWVLPLSLYLLTFVIAFSKKPIISYDFILKLHPPAAATAIAMSIFISTSFTTSWWALALHLLAFSIVTLMCHMRLAQKRPLENHDYLTEFYLMISIGGALGGLLIAFIVPIVFNGLIEYPILMLLSAALNKNISKRLSRPEIYLFMAGLVLSILLAILQKNGYVTENIRNTFFLIIFILLMLHPRTLLIGGVISSITLLIFTSMNPQMISERNFYGIISLYKKDIKMTDGETVKVRYMRHGTTIHGSQVLDKKYEKEPTLYYTYGSPLNDAIQTMKPKTIAAVGLGTGAINCYSKPDREITFFEIDAAVIKMARDHFTYLSNCGHTEPEVILGDARLELKKIQDKKYDMIILDAFSSDTIPTHLLTKEALELYKSRLEPNGVILFHISNRYFDLRFTLSATGKALDLNNRVTWRESKNPYAAPRTDWMILAPQHIDLTPLTKQGWTEEVPTKRSEIWTDDYTALLSILK